MLRCDHFGSIKESFWKGWNHKLNPFCTSKNSYRVPKHNQKKDVNMRAERKGKKGNGKGMEKERVLSFPVQENFDGHFHPSWPKNG